MWGERGRCGGLPALARVRAARGVRVVGEEGAQKGVDDGRVGAVAGELVRARVADNLGQVEVCVREGEDGEVVAAGGERRGEDEAVEGARRAQVGRVAGHLVQLEKHVVHAAPLGEEHALPQRLAARSERPLDAAANPSRHRDNHLTRQRGAGELLLREKPRHELVQRVEGHRVVRARAVTRQQLVPHLQGVVEGSQAASRAVPRQQLVPHQWVVWKQVARLPVLRLPRRHHAGESPHRRRRRRRDRRVACSQPRVLRDASQLWAPPRPPGGPPVALIR